MLRPYQIPALAAVVVLIGAASAFADSAPTMQAPAASVSPLPQERADAQAANPAQPNCYPDVNHCASYPTGDTVRDNSYQYLSPQQIQQGQSPQPNK